MQWNQNMTSRFVDRQSLESCRRSICLLACLHFDISSDRLLRIFPSGCNIIISFSFKHKLHLTVSLLNGAHFLTISQVTVGVNLESFMFQNSFDNSVSSLYFSVWNDFLWLAYLFLKDVSVDP